MRVVQHKLPDDFARGRDFNDSGGAGNQRIAVGQSVGISNRRVFPRKPPGLPHHCTAFRIDFNGTVGPLMVGDQDMAVGKHLWIMLSDKNAFTENSNHSTVGLDFNHPVEVSQADEGVTV
jgi:hypothetical protein